MIDFDALRTTFLNSTNPAMREVDMVLLTIQVFLPLIFAAIILCVPARAPGLMRWLALIATAATLTMGACRFVDYYTLLDSYSDRSLSNFYQPESRLDTRSDRQMQDAAHLPLPKPYRSDDLLTRRPWISTFNIDYALGVDGINLALVLLTGVVMLTAVVASWTMTENLRGYFVLLLTLQTGITGAFLSLDLFLFFVFYEVLLLPMFFLIGLWGGKRRSYAAMKFVIYTLIGSIGILTAFIALYSVDVRDFVPQGIVAAKAADLRQNDPRLTAEEAKAKAEVHSFDVVTLAKSGRAVRLILDGEEARIGVAGSSTPEQVPLFAAGVNRTEAIARLKAQSICTKTVQYVVFALLFLGFAVKLPLVPLHGWLPDAHVEAPTPVSMVLAGVLLKLGGYGLLRFAYPLCPWAAHECNFVVGVLGCLAVVYGAFAALGQSDFKKLLAYSSISHMGYVVLGLAAWSGSREQYEWAVNGAVFQMLSHGITSAGLFFVVGMIYERAHHRELDLLGGLKEPMPVFTGAAVILIFASTALPGLCGFVGEFLVMLGLWSYSPWLTLPAILTTIVTAGYLLWAFQRAFLGVNPATAAYPDASVREGTVLFVYCALAIFLGILPSLVFPWIDPSVYAWVESLG